MEELDAAMDSWRVDASDVPLPFSGGCAGFFGYELAAEFETVPRIEVRDHALPDLELAFYDVVLGWDHQSSRCFIVSTGRPEIGPAAHARATDRLDETVAWLCGDARRPNDAASEAFDRTMSGIGVSPGATTGQAVAGSAWLQSTTTAAGYAEAVARTIDYIREGEVYQVNLSQRFAAHSQASPLDVFRALRSRSPSPYGAMFRSPAGCILSSSPERFLRADGVGGIETRPIKGTRPRGRTPEEDRALSLELLDSEKDRAENLMIVDLLRNDLSKICVPGSVSVPGLFRLESWATVHHLVSVIAGQLRADTTPGEVIRATFPSGSVTGAPKIRAMELIASLESVARGPYCGAIGYLSFDGQMDLSVAIRILVLADGRATYHAGGGVVFDSVPEDEYRESLVKARALTGAIAETLEAGRTER
jgi:para-aminobenzoate synthetase component 1